MTDEPATTPAADRVTALTLRCGQLREQRDIAIRTCVELRATIAQLGEQRDEARREVERYSETIRAIGLRNMRLQREAREARAQAVQATTDADNLRARVPASRGLAR